MEIAINIMFLVASGFWLQQGLTVYKFWAKNQPGSGFIPVIFSLLVILLSSISLIRAIIKMRAAASGKTVLLRFQWEFLRPFIPVAFAIVAIFAIRLIGVVPAVFLSSFFWLRFISQYRIGKSLLVTVPITLFIYLIFVLWLRVPFPRGVFGI